MCILNKKSQVWTIDLIAGISLFILTIVIFFIFAKNPAASEVSDFNDINADAGTVSSSLISAGVPNNWNLSTVEEIGITNGRYRLNRTKLAYLKEINYSNAKLLLKSKYDYIIFFENKNSEVLEFLDLASNDFSYIGKSNVTKENIYEEEPLGLVISRRFLIMESNIISMVVYIWE